MIATKTPSIHDCRLQMLSLYAMDPRTTASQIGNATLAHIAVSAQQSALSTNHNISSAHDAVVERVTARACMVITFGNNLSA